MAVGSPIGLNFGKLWNDMKYDDLLLTSPLNSSSPLGNSGLLGESVGIDAKASPEIEEFRKNGYSMIDLICKYHQTIEDYPVVSTVKPNQIRTQLATHPPENGEEYSQIEKDVQDIIIPGLTHWQHPNFFAYFPTSCSFPAVLGELLAAGLGVQGMQWITSPACTELETHVLDWMATLLKLPKSFMSRFSGGVHGGGIIQGTASEAVVVMLIAARWRHICHSIPGITNQMLYNISQEPETAEMQEKREKMDIIHSRSVAYVSESTHSMVLKGCMVVGIRNVRMVGCDANYAMCPKKLEEQIQKDLKAGYIPIFVCATIGTTATAAVDPLTTIGPVCNKYNVWLHVDGAYAGSFCLLPELRHNLNGVEFADSVNINPHKCLLTGFECSLLWVKDRRPINGALTLTPPYLTNNVSETEDVIDYKDWEVPLGRRFRSLKLWFVLRMLGVNGIKAYLRRLVDFAVQFKSWVEKDSRFEVAGGGFSLVCFRLKGVGDKENSALISALLKEKNLFLVHAQIDGKLTIRMAMAATTATIDHIKNAWLAIQDTTTKLFPHLNLSN